MASLGDLAADEPGAIAIGPFGSRMKSDVYVDAGVPVIRGFNISTGRSLKGDWVYVPEDFAKTLPNCIVREGDLVFPHRGAIGEVALITRPYDRMILSTSMMKFRANPRLADNAYLYYYFRSTVGRAEILKFASQVGTPGIGQPLTSLRQFQVPLLPIDTQKSISAVLSALDDLIDLNHKMNEDLEALARSMFKAWFIDFAPVKAKATGATSFPGMPRNLFEQLSDRLDTTPSGVLPSTWRTGRLADIAHLNPDSWSARQHPERLEYVDLSSTKRGLIQEIDLYDWEQAPSRARRILKSGDTIVGTVRPGNESYALVQREGLTGSTGFAVLRPSSLYYREQIYCAATSAESIAYLARLADGAAYPAVRPEVVSDMPIALPPPGISQGFSNVSAPLFDLIATNQQMNEDLASLRDAIVLPLITGQIGLRDVPGVNHGN